MIPLSELDKDTAATVVDVQDHHAADPIARRLRELGFVAGEQVIIKAWGPFRRDPVMVHIGDSRFALRRSEAARIPVQVS